MKKDTRRVHNESRSSCGVSIRSNEDSCNVRSSYRKEIYKREKQPSADSKIF